MSKTTFYDPLNYCFLFIDVTRKPWKSFKLFLVKSNGFYVLTTIRIVSINELMELKTKEEHRTAGENAERIYVTDLLQSEPTPLTLSMPPLRSRSPSMPPSFSLFHGHKSQRSFIRPVSRPDRPPGLKEEKRAGEKAGWKGGEGMRALHSHSKMQHTNFHVNFPCDRRDGCLWLVGWCGAYIDVKMVYYVGQRL